MSLFFWFINSITSTKSAIELTFLDNSNCYNSRVQWRLFFQLVQEFPPTFLMHQEFDIHNPKAPPLTHL